MSFAERPGFAYIGRHELQRSGHYTDYALGVEIQHQEAWLLSQRERFPNTKIYIASEWPNNGTILAYYVGLPGQHTEAS